MIIKHKYLTYKFSFLKLNDIEVQVMPEDFLINRANFYLSLLDFAKRPTGENYDKIKDVIVIFVCMFDPFNENQKLYHFRMYDPKLNMELSPNRRILFLNCKGTKGRVNASVQGYIVAMNGDLSSTEPLVQSVKNDLEKISHNRIEVAKIMELKEKERVRAQYYKKEGIDMERLVGVKKLIRTIIRISNDDATAFNEAKAQYGDYYTDDQLKEFIAEARNRTLQEA